jgi:hypothetical protein
MLINVVFITDLIAVIFVLYFYYDDFVKIFATDALGEIKIFYSIFFCILCPINKKRYRYRLGSTLVILLNSGTQKISGLLLKLYRYRYSVVFLFNAGFFH